mmetsp:Transcript_7628/g.11541  ORF Transcript_7628/g.11541 Transcript_7628/m.11541 type:complete len:149 (+) Transcript_7628:108-554(+)
MTDSSTPNETQLKEMTKLANQVKENSYSPYSHFRVGAVVLSESGSYYCGTNVENACYSLTVCAERAAIFHAVATEGDKFKMAAILVTTDIEKECKWCCGACGSVILEFGEDIPVFSVPANSEQYQMKRIRELLPFAFSKATLDAASSK